MTNSAPALVGAAATVGEASPAHEACHRPEILETEQNTKTFRETFDRADEAASNANNDRDSINACRKSSWLHPVNKTKKKNEMRIWKNLTRVSNHPLRSVYESFSSGADTSLIAASSRSPPGSNLAGEDINAFAHGVLETPDEGEWLTEEEWSDESPPGYAQTESSKANGHSAAYLYSSLTPACTQFSTMPISSPPLVLMEPSPSVLRYECSYCSKRFSRSSSLRIHLATHASDKPYVCPVKDCGRNFSIQSNMRHHLRIAHG